MAERTTTGSGSSDKEGDPHSTAQNAASSTSGPASETSDTPRSEGYTPIGRTSERGKSPEVKQFIKPSAWDDELEPDALRGSEHVIYEGNVEDREEERRDIYRSDEEKRIRQRQVQDNKDRYERRRREREQYA